MDYIGGLPDYMKICLISLDDLTNEIGNNVYNKYGYNPVNHLREAWATLCNAFLEEFKWFASSAEPKADEYLEIARVSSGAHIVMVHIFFLLGFGGTGDNEISLDDIKEITSSVATILRLSDDLGSAKDENQNGHDGSYIEYYMKEHEGISNEVAQKHVLEMISNEWKLLNKEQLRLSQHYPISFTRAALNMARLVPLMYSYDGNQRLPILEENIKSLLFDDMY
ncbi:hypothetical protein Leryth_019634 [Lithospermum erythrorhizon]|nr:hypothetical protein Leryth_019634 [Lithospermum erythrorhizon]